MKISNLQFPQAKTLAGPKANPQPDSFSVNDTI